MKKLLIVVLLGLFAVNGAFASAEKKEEGELKAFTNEELDKMIVINPDTEKTVTVADLIGKKAFDSRWEYKKIEKAGWHNEYNIPYVRGEIILVEKPLPIEEVIKDIETRKRKGITGLGNEASGGLVYGIILGISATAIGGFKIYKVQIGKDKMLLPSYPEGDAHAALIYKYKKGLIAE